MIDSLLPGWYIVNPDKQQGWAKLSKKHAERSSATTATLAPFYKRFALNNGLLKNDSHQEEPAMGRPDLTDLRTAEILDAFERCIARYGLEGSSLELIAEEAGMRRSILRHYVGNREDLILALCDRVVVKYQDEFQAFIDSLSGPHRVDELVDYFLPQKPKGTTASVLVVESLIAAAESIPQVRDQMGSYIDFLVTRTASQLGEATKASQQDCWSVAYGLIAIWFNQESLVSLHLSPRHLRAARQSMRTLIASLQ